MKEQKEGSSAIQQRETRERKRKRVMKNERMNEKRKGIEWREKCLRKGDHVREIFGK